MYDFDYKKAASLDEALASLKADPEAMLLAGGMTLIPVLKQRLREPSTLVDISDLAELSGLSREGDRVVIGAMTSHAQVQASGLVRADIPALAELAGQIGDPAVRNRGTLGGSLAVSDPAADYPAAVLALNATIRTERREIAADDYFIDLFETALSEDEIILSVSFPVPLSAIYMKLFQPASRFAIAGVFLARTREGVRVAVTGAGPCAFRLSEAEEKLSADFSVKALNGIEFSPENFNSDVHAAADYRAHMIRTLLSRAVAALS